jgi:HD-GYP domain-containing protein (c-di-GMP phosphodiesterase class II)
MSLVPDVDRSAADGDRLAARCRELNLPLWRFGSAAELLREPQGPHDLLAFLHSPAVRAAIENAARSALTSEVGAESELFPGCHLIPLIDSEGSRRTGVSIGLVLGSGSATSADFVRLCTSAGLDPESFRAVLDAHLLRSDLASPRTAAALRWSHEDIARVRRDGRTLDQFSDKLLQAYEEINLLFRLARFLNCVSEPAELLRVFCNQLHQVLPFRWIAIRFDPQGTQVRELTDGLFTAGELPCPREQFAQLCSQTLGRFNGVQNWVRLLEPGADELATLAGADVLAEPVTHDGRVIAALLAGNKQGDDLQISSAETQFLDAAAGFLGVFHENISRLAEQQAFFFGTVRALTASIDAKDRYTRGHSERVAVLAARAAAAIGLPRKTVEQYHIAGLVHDVGKIGIPEAVLTKTGRLTPEEFEHIKKHPETGYGILKDIPALTDVLPGVLHHHERWDGGGYPHKIARDQIPLIGRVLALADTFDAMSSNRSYRPAMPREQVIAEIRRCAGTQFDPALVPAFCGLDFSEFDRVLKQHQSAGAIAA